MDENIKEKDTAQQGNDELDLEKAIAAAKEEKAKLIAKNMASSSFEDEVIQDNGKQVRTDSALQKVKDAVKDLYLFFRNLAAIVMLTALLYVGIMIILNKTNFLAIIF